MSFTVQQFPHSRVPRWAPFIMNFTAGGCRQQGPTNHSVDRSQSHTKQCKTMQLGATKFFSELGNVGSDYDHPPHSRKLYNAWLSGLGSRGSPITVRPETKRKYTPTTIQQCRINKPTIIVISIARINEHNTSFYSHQQDEMNEIFNCSYAAIERVILSMLDTSDH